MDDEISLLENRDTDRLAIELSKAILNSEEYTLYMKCLEEIKSQPELYDRVNELRRQHFELQNSSRDKMSFDDFTRLSTMSRELRENTIVNDFLNAEIGFGRLMQEINRLIMKDVYFDNDFLK